MMRRVTEQGVQVHGEHVELGIATQVHPVVPRHQRKVPASVGVQVSRGRVMHLRAGGSLHGDPDRVIAWFGARFGAPDYCGEQGWLARAEPERIKIAW